MTTLKKIDRYILIRLLGAGGMGEVYEAQDPNVDRPVALKILKDVFNTDEFRERFLREARAAAKLAEHPNIVKVFDAKRFKGRPFIAMEYIAGSSLAQLIARAEPLTLTRKLEILEELCAGLAWAHSAGIIHRDIKPGNVMVDVRGHVKIVDFGIAKSDAGEATSQQIAIGTPCYMSPEQLRRQPVDARTDIFSTGVVAFELLTFRKLFEGDALQQLARVVSGHVPLMSGAAGIIPTPVERIVRRALATDPADRFKDMAAMQDALRAVRSQLPVRGLSLNSAAPAWGGVDTVVADGGAGEDGLVSRRNTRAGVVAAMAVMAMTIGSWLLLSQPTPNATPTTAPHKATVAPAAESTSSRAPLQTPRGRRAGANSAKKTRGIDAGGGPSPMPAEASEPIADSTLSPIGAAPPAPSAASTESAPPSPLTSSPNHEPIDLESEASDEAAIHSALAAYQAAFEKGSAASVKDIWPSLTESQAAALDSEFLNAQSYRVEISNTQIVRISHTKAQVYCTITKRLRPKQGDARTISSSASISFERSDERWLIEGISERAIDR